MQRAFTSAAACPKSKCPSRDYRNQITAVRILKQGTEGRNLPDKKFLILADRAFELNVNKVQFPLRSSFYSTREGRGLQLPKVITRTAKTLPATSGDKDPAFRYQHRH